MPGDGRHAFAAGTDENAVTTLSEGLINPLNF